LASTADSRTSAVGSNRAAASASAPEWANPFLAERLREFADLLEQQQANRFRVHAYRAAADTIATLREDLRILFEREGHTGLEAVPGIGHVIAAAITEMLRTGRWS
jgi:putative hydrolase